MMRVNIQSSHLTRAVVSVALASAGAVAAAELRPESVEGWKQYTAAVETRRARELQGGSAFLVMDREREGPADRKALLAGEMVVRKMEARTAGGESIEVPSALVHHWRGAVFLPGATLDQLMRTLEAEAPPASPEVLRSAVLGRGPESMKVYLRIQRTKIVTVVYNTEHEVTFVRHGAGRAGSTSVATRIAEVENPGTPAERERPAGDDRGFLWRLNAYWRYEAVTGGVIAECESLSLSRGVPFGLQTITGPIISGTARESMERTLASLRVMAGRKVVG